MKRVLRGTRVWRIPAAGIFASLLLLWAARRSVAFAEWYATAVYPVFVRIAGGFWGLVPFSVGEWIVYGLSLAVLLFIARLAVCLLCRRERLRALLRRGGLTFLWAFSALFLLYGAHCGVNYYRLPFSSFSGLDIRPSTARELAALGEELVAEANVLAEKVPAGDGGATALSRSPLELSRRAREVMRGLGETYPQLSGYYPPAKPVLFSKGMSRLDITGVYFPPTIEANVNMDVPAYNIAATACHELSHLRGFMREDEANFIAYLACRSSGDDEFCYSGDMLALVHVSNALYRADAALAGELRAKMGPRVRADLAANDDYWSRMEGPVATVSEAVNNTYLKANAQADGVRSYGRMVDLLLADFRSRGGGAA